ncbi:MAG: succinate dehydrogenase cytochrome b subunit [Akkermansia sp.]|nr:succinate dehydrogenase cytochrome b subunit [Akkermansia sp.]
MNAIVQTACKFVTSSIGRKIIVAVTGACLLAFLVGHLIGSLTVYGGREWINNYAFGLHAMPSWVLWSIRLGLLAVALIHVIYTLALQYENRNARRQYEYRNTIQATLSSRTMLVSGCMILCFVLFHLFQFPAQVETLDGRPDCYALIAGAFANPFCSAFYIIAIFCLGCHVCHGVESVMQTAGLSTKKIRPLYKIASWCYAVIVCGAFISIPVSVLLGIISNN